MLPSHGFFDSNYSKNINRYCFENLILNLMRKKSAILFCFMSSFEMSKYLRLAEQMRKVLAKKFVLMTSP